MISIYDIANSDFEDIFNRYHDDQSEYDVEFHDDVLYCTGTELIFTRIILEYWRNLPKAIPILAEYCVARQRDFHPEIHLDLIGIIYKQYLALYEGTDHDIDDRDMNDHVYRNIVQHLWHFAVEHLDAYTHGSTSLDMIQIIQHPPIKEAHDKLMALKREPTGDEIAAVHDIIEHETMNSLVFDENPLVIPLRCKAIRMGQMAMMAGPVGYCTDINSSLFKYAYRNSFYRGGAELWEFAIESRNASIASLYNDLIIPIAQYGNRRYQLHAQAVRWVVAGDCNTKHLDETFVVDMKKLKSLEGLLYKNDKGIMELITTKHKHLIGTHIELRSVVVCAWATARSEVCSTCYGTLARSIVKYRKGTSANAKGRNIGHIAAINIGEQSTSSVLARKHANATSTAAKLQLNIEQSAYLRVAEDGKHLFIHSNITDIHKMKIQLRPKQVGCLHDYCSGVIDKVNPSTATAIEDFSILNTALDDGVNVTEITVGSKERRAYLTREALEYIKEHRWEYGGAKEHIISLDKWDESVPFFALPQVEFSPPEFIAHCSKVMFGPMDKKAKAEGARRLSGSRNIVEAVDTLYDELSARLTIHYTHVAVMVLSLSAQNPRAGDYRLPYPRHKGVVCTESPLLDNSSMGMSMAYEEQHKIVTLPSSYVLLKRRSHPLDSLLLSSHYGNPKNVLA